MKTILRFSFIFFLGVIFLTGFTISTLAQTELDGKYMTMTDAQGKVVTRTAHQIWVGDEYLTSDNRLYRVIRVTDQTAVARLVKREKLVPPTASIWNEITSWFKAEVKQRGPICIYHTHSDESYIRGDGASSKKVNGGIENVGATLAQALESKGIPVIHDRTDHFPHDAMAYDRSRRTAVQLLKKQPVALLDIHRDAVPAEEYTAVVNGQGVTKVQLVLGRQNPNFAANKEFAQQVKAEVDRKYPNLIKGIFIGKGKYNQDLGPKSLILEMGTNTNSKAAAERCARIFAAAASGVLYGPSGNKAVNRGSSRSAFYIAAVAVGGLGLFLLLNRSGMKGLIKEFGGRKNGGNDE